MRRQLSLFVGSTALAAILSMTAAAQECASGAAAPSVDAGAPVYGPEYCDGGHGVHKRGPAILTPVEAYGVQPPGVNCCKHGAIVPYYAPLAPTPTCYRYRTTCYTPYYCSYCGHHLHGPKPPPYGADGWGKGPMPGQGPDGIQPNYGVFTSVLQDDTIFWNMGGNGLVPYGTPHPPRNGPPDIVDMIQVTRRSGSGCHPGPDGAPVVVVTDGAAPAITPPAEKSAPPR
jgi:hypothetical protein